MDTIISNRFRSLYVINCHARHSEVWWHTVQTTLIWSVPLCEGNNSLNPRANTIQYLTRAIRYYSTVFLFLAFLFQRNSIGGFFSRGGLAALLVITDMSRRCWMRTMSAKHTRNTDILRATFIMHNAEVPTAMLDNTTAVGYGNATRWTHAYNEREKTASHTTRYK